MGGLSHTVSGNIASFRTPSRVPIESLKFHFLPKQAAGTPSPENPIPIEGWTGVNGTRTHKNMLKVYKYSAQNSETLTNPKLTNDYGTTINTTDGTVQELVVTQSQHPHSTASNYQNGYISIWSKTLEFGNYYDISMKIDVTDNPLNVTLGRLVLLTPQGSTKYPTVKENILIFKNVLYSPYVRDGVQILTRKTLELRICGMSMKISEIMATPAYKSDGVYESYSEELIPITFPDGQTIYGGYIDPVAGEIVAEWKAHTFDGTERIDEYSGSFTGGIRLANNTFDDCTSLGNMTKCDKAVLETTTPSDISRLGIRIGGGQYRFYFYVPDSMFDGGATVDKFKTWLSENGMTVVAKLSTPIHIPIPAQDLKAFLGHNNFWSDANDIIEVTYPVTESKDILKARKLIMAGSQPHIETASGPIASFDTDMKAPVKELKAYFTPVQEGSGDPSPVNVRPIHGWTGLNIEHSAKNLLDVDQCTIKKWRLNSNVFTVLPDDDQYVNYSLNNGIFTVEITERWRGFCFEIKPVNFERIYSIIGDADAIQLWAAYETGAERLISYSTINGILTCKVPANMGGILSVRYDNIGTYTTKIQCELSNVSGIFEKYSGGIVSITFPATKNLIDYEIGTTKRNNGVDYAVLPNHGINCQGTAVDYTSYGIESKTVQLRAGTYTFSVSGGVNVKTVFVKNGAYWFEISGSGKSSKTLSEEATIHFYVMVTRGTEVDETLFVQIESGLYATGFEPYGTAYGGYIDLIRGKFVLEYYRGLVKSASGKLGNFFYNVTSNIGMPAIADTNSGLYADRLPNEANVSEVATNQSITIYQNQIMRWIEEDYIESSLSDYNAYLAENPFEIVYKMKYPIEYDLTPQQLKTLKGQNNIWSNANGNVDVKYWTH